VATGKNASAIGSWALRVLIGVVVLAALLSIGFVLFGVSGETLGRVVSTNIALVVFALLVWVDSLIGRRRPDWFEFASLAFDAYLLLLWVSTIWFGPFDGGAAAVDFFVSFGALLWVRAMIGLADLLRLLWMRWRSSVTDAVAIVGLIAIALVAVLVTLPAPEPLHDLWDFDYYGRIIGALSIVAGVCFVLVPLWALVQARGERAVFPGGAPQYGAPQYGTPQGYAAPAPAAPSEPKFVAPAPVVVSEPVVAPQQVASEPAAAPAPQVAPQPLAWPSLANGRPVPAGSDGRPDFASLSPSERLAWPTFVDGTPVPAGPDGAPLYR
jgi:hypothetical protein